MSKKKKKSKKRRQKERLKRRQRQLLAQKQAQAQSAKKEGEKTPKPKPKKPAPAKAEEIPDKSPERKMVVRDIRKFLWIFVLIVATLIGVGLIISRTSWLNPVTDWIVNLTGK